MSQAFRLFYRFIWRHLMRNALRTGLTVMGITLGVGILLAIHLANESVLANFRNTVDLVSGQANGVIRSTGEPAFNEGVIRQLSWLRLFNAEVSPVLETTVTRQGELPEVIQVLGLDLMNPNTYARYGIMLEKLPEKPLSLFQLNHGWAGRGLIEASEGLLPLPVWFNETSLTLQPLGVLQNMGIGRAYNGKVWLMDLAVAQQSLGLLGKISRIDLVVPQAALPKVLDKLNETLPKGLVAERPSQRGEQVEKMVRSFQANLTAVSFIALLVGMFLIYNTMSISILRRRQEIGTLRALGVSRRSVFGLFLAEALTLGTLGSVLGVCLGVLLSQGALSSVSRTVSSLYISQSVTEVALDPIVMLFGFGLGVLMTVIGAIPPVWAATTIAPAEATRRRSEEVKATRLVSVWAWVGFALWGVAGVLSLQSPVGGLPLWGYGSALFVVLGAAFLSPVFVQGAIRLFSPLLKRTFGMTGKVAVLNLNGALGRTSVAVASLMVGIAMMVSLALMITSFRETVIQWVNQSFRAELVVKPPSRITGKITGKLDPQVIATIGAHPAVLAMGQFYEFPITYQGQPAHLGIWNVPVLFQHGFLRFVDGESSDAVLKRLLQHPAVVVTESFSVRNHVAKGDLLDLDTPEGVVSLAVEGVFYDYTSDQGYVILPRTLYQQYYHDDSVSDLAVFLKPANPPEAIRLDLIRQLGIKHQVLMTTQGEVKGEVLRIFDETFSITYALHAIAIVVAILGIVNTLFAQVLESRRDFGILRYLGASARQIRQVVLIQAGFLGCLGSVSGMLVGWVLSLLLIYVINRQSFGWSIQFSLDSLFLLESFVLVMVTAILSGLLPARIAEKLPPAQVIREE